MARRAEREVHIFLTTAPQRVRIVFIFICVCVGTLSAAVFLRARVFGFGRVYIIMNCMDFLSQSKWCQLVARLYFERVYLPAIGASVVA